MQLSDTAAPLRGHYGYAISAYVSWLAEDRDHVWRCARAV
jgi:hypothetical protein